MEFINQILKRDASYASKNMVADISVTTSTTKLAMKANISKVRGIRERGTYRRNNKSSSSQQSGATKVGAVDNNLSLPLDNSKYVKLTPFEKPLFESAIMSGKTMKEALSFARKNLFMKMRKRASEKVTRNAVYGDFKQPQSEKQTSNEVGGTVHLSLVPFDVKHAPLSFTQMEKIQATIIDMMIEHNRREINAESLNCQFKTGWMAFKCNTATAEWLKQNCNAISEKCKVKLNVVEDQDEKQNQTKSTRTPRLKRHYYLALHHLKELKKAKDNGVPLKNAQLIRSKYESMIEDYLETQKNGRRLRKLLILDGLLDRPKKAKPLHKRYRMALHRLDKLKKIEESGTPLDEKKLMSRRRLQAVVDEFLKEQADDKKPIGKSPKSFRPFHEVITDPLCVAVGGKRKGLFVPIPIEWPAIELQINELVASYVLENQAESPVPRYDMNEIHRGFRVIKCMDEFSKKFLFKCITSLKDKLKELNLMIIPASQIPKGRRDPIDLKAEAALKKMNQGTDIGSSKSVKTIPSVSVSTSAENMDFQTPLKKTGALQDHGRVKPENRHYQISNPVRSLEFGTPQHHNLMDKIITSNIHCIDKTEYSPRDLPNTQYLAQQPQNSRNTAEFSFENRFNPLRGSDYKTHSNAVSTNIRKNFTENTSFGDEFSLTSCRNKNYLNSTVESEFSNRFSGSNETLRRSSERSDSQSHVLMNSRDRRTSPHFYASSGSNRTKFYQDSFPDCRNPYSIDKLPASSRRSSERNPVQTHTLNNSDDWRRSPDFYENSRSYVTKFDQDSPLQCSNAFRNHRWLDSNEISMRSREKIPVDSQTLANSERGWKSSDIYEDLSSPPGSYRSLYRNDRERSANEILMRNRNRNPTLMDTEKRRRSPDFHAKLTQSYEDSPPHYSNPYRNSSSSDSFNNRYRKPDSFDILSTEAAKHNVRGKESYRSDESYGLSGHRDFESFPNYFTRTDSRNNNSYRRREKSYLPSDDDDVPPPPPRWN